MRYGKLGKPSLLVIGSLLWIASGVEYEAGFSAAEASLVGMLQMSPMNDLNASRWVLRKAFMGSIQCSFDPKEAMFAKPCNDLAMRVKLLRAFGFGSSKCLFSMNPTYHKMEMTYPSIGQRAWGSTPQDKRTAGKGSRKHCYS